jgi:hypothetical protein
MPCQSSQLFAGRFHVNFINKNPAELLINLKTSLFYVTQQISLNALAYLLRLDCQLIEVVTTHGLDETSQPRVLTYSQRKTLDSFPKDPGTIALIYSTNVDALVNQSVALRFTPSTVGWPNCFLGWGWKIY